jgi:hypothetical protein
MTRGKAWVAAAALIVGLPLALAAAQGASKEIQEVFVANFPETQKIEGSVTIGAPIPHAALVSLRDILVQPVGPQDTNHLVLGGTIATDGFSGVVLSLAGSTRGDVTRSGSVGAILVPEDEGVLKVLEERGAIEFPIEIRTAGVSAATPYFTSTPTRAVVAFPKYRVLLYNTTDKSVTVTVYAYLTN